MSDESKGLYIDDHGSLCVVGAWDDETQEILEQGAPDDAMWMGDAVVVEHGFVDGVIEYVEREYEARGYRRVS